jgi:hypothetical protein
MSTISELAPKYGIRAAEYCCRYWTTRGGSSREGSTISVLGLESEYSSRFPTGRYYSVSVFVELIYMLLSVCGVV